MITSHVVTSHAILAVLWIGWCALHSAMITPAVTGRLDRRPGGAARYYRVLFNLVAVITFVPILNFGLSLDSPAVWTWDGPFAWAQAVLLALALTLFITGARHYDLRRFLGLRQIAERGRGKGASETRTGEGTTATGRGKGLTDTGHIDTTGVLSVTRHPWYAGGIALLWSSDIDAARLVSNIILTAYLVVGTVIEERKLVAEYGDEYREYQNRVPMLLPIGFLTSRRKG